MYLAPYLPLLNMSGGTRYIINFQTHYFPYVRSCRALVMQVATLIFWSGSDRQTIAKRDDSLLFV